MMRLVGFCIIRGFILGRAGYNHFYTSERGRLLKCGDKRMPILKPPERVFPEVK